MATKFLFDTTKFWKMITVTVIQHCESTEIPHLKVVKMIHFMFTIYVYMANFATISENLENYK